MGTAAGGTGLKDELLYDHYMCQESDNVTKTETKTETETATAKQVAGWIYVVALELG